MAFSVLGSLITLPLHLMSAVNNLGLKFVLQNVRLNKAVVLMCFSFFINMQIKKICILV